MNERLLTREELIAKGYPFGKVNNDIPFGDPATEWMRTNPDVKVYIPKEDMGRDCGNECLSVIPTPDEKELLAIWTQSSGECCGDNRIVIARSEDGTNWSQPQVIIGAKNEQEKQSSWGMPMYSKSGRLYIFFIQETDHQDRARVDSGDLVLMYSNDNGRTWSDPGISPLPRCRYDHPDPGVAKNWWSFQAPIRDADGKFISGFTIHTSPVVKKDDLPHPHTDTRAAFIRFENIDEDPEPKDVQVTILPKDGLEVPDKKYPQVSVAQEADPVLLPDGRLFATIRTMSEYIYYTVYDGKEWSEPNPLIGWDGKPQPHPLAPCPTYRLKEDTYLCLTHNNTGKGMEGYDIFEDSTPNALASDVARNPLFLIVGKYDPNNEQPIRFGKPKRIADTDFVAVGHRKGYCYVAGYTSVVKWRGKTMLWYPDRKYYILGKELTDEILYS